MRVLLSVLATISVASPAFAHPGMEGSTSFVHEFLHLSEGFGPLILVLAIAAGIYALKKRF